MMSSTLRGYSLDHLTVLRVHGVDAHTFLQGQLTCHLDEVSPQTVRLGAHCNIKGRMTALCEICQLGADYYLVLPRAIQDSAVKHLTKYARFSKVELTLLPEVKVFGFAGAIADITTALDLSKPIEQANATAADDARICFQHGRTERWIYFDLNNHQDLHALVSDQLCDWQAQDIQQKLPWLTVDTVNRLIPNEIALEKMGGVSFNKGCYLGQEIIVRIQHLGQLKKQLAIIEIEGVSPQVATDIHNTAGKLCGELVNVATDSHGKAWGLVLLRTDQANPPLSFVSSAATIRLL